MHLLQYKVTRNRRAGFTLTEMLVVVAIVLLLAGVTIPAALIITAGDRVKSAANTLQATLAGARDRATGAGSPVGLRFIPNDNDRSLIQSMVYIREAAPIADGSVMVMHNTWPATLDTAAALSNALFNRVVLIGVDPIRLAQLPSAINTSGVKTYYGSIRLGKAGALRSFWTNDTYLNQVPNNPFLILDEPLAMPIPFATTVNPIDTSGTYPYNVLYRQAPPFLDPAVGVEYTIELGSVPLENSDPVQLPAGTAIDLGYIDPNWGLTAAAVLDSSDVRLSRFRPNAAGQWEILFSPTGKVIGSAAADPQIILWLRELTSLVEEVNVGTGVTATGRQKLVNSTAAGQHRLVTVYSRTGLVLNADPVFQSTAAFGGVNYFNFNEYYNNVPIGSNAGL